MDGLFVLLGLLAVALGAHRAFKLSLPPSGVRVLMPPKRDRIDEALFKMGLVRQPSSATERAFAGVIEGVQLEVTMDPSAPTRLSLRMAQASESFLVERAGDDLNFLGDRTLAISRLNADLLDALGKGAWLSQEQGVLNLQIPEYEPPPKGWVLALIRASRGPEHAAARLAEIALRGERHELRILALQALARLDAEQRAPTLKRALADGDFRVRETAAALLSQDIETLASTWARSPKEPIALRCQAAIFLALERYSERTVRLLVELFESQPQPQDLDAKTVVIEAVDALVEQINPEGADHFHSWLSPCAAETVDALLGRFLHGPRSELAMGATAALGAHGSPASIPALESLRGPRALLQAGRRAADQIRARAGGSGALSITRAGQSAEGALSASSKSAE